MIKKIRYGLVLVIAGAAVLATVLITGLLRNNRENSEATGQSSHTADSGEQTDDPDPEGGSTSESIVAPTKPEMEVRDDREQELILFDDSEKKDYPGLRGYFQGRLKIDPEKVALYLNVREEAEPEGKILTILYPDDLVEYKGRRGDWYWVRANGFEGYVHASLVLTDDAAYLDMKDSVGYAAMVANNNTYLYMDPEDDNTGVIVASKSDSYRVVGIKGDSYKVTGDFVDYSYLYVLKSQSVLYYMFLGPDNDNGLSEEDAAKLGQLDISENIARTYVIQNEAQTEKEAYESMVASMEEERRQQEIQESILASVAQASKDAANSQANAAAAFLQAQKAFDAAHAAERAAYLAAMQADAAHYDISTLTPITYTNGAGVTTDNCRVTYYCHCTKCCKAWGVNDVNYVAHANGMTLIEDYSVAVDRNIIPIGTRMLAVLYNGSQELSRQILIAADTGVGGLSIDIYRRTHTYAQKAYTLSALPAGMYNAMYYVKLYRLP